MPDDSNGLDPSDWLQRIDQGFSGTVIDWIDRDITGPLLQMVIRPSWYQFMSSTTVPDPLNSLEVTVTEEHKELERLYPETPLAKWPVRDHYTITRGSSYEGGDDWLRIFFNQDLSRVEERRLPANWENIDVYLPAPDELPRVGEMLFGSDEE